MANSRLKNRLVGTVVIIALGVIVLPQIFDAEGYRQIEPLRLEIPAGPTFEVEQDVSGLLKTRSQMDAEADAIKKDISAHERQAKWIVIAGSFKFPKNAGMLVAKLAKAGHDAKISTTGAEGGERYYVVELEPFLNEDEATDAAADIKKKFSVSARVVQKGVASR